jgi:serine/threonine-protein kinase
VAERSLATVLFTDIVGSTERAGQLGDRAWQELLARHHECVRRELRLRGGREVATAGDGFLAVFDQPAAAIRGACGIRDSVGRLGIQVRAGLHMGEIERAGREVGGIAVHIGQRVCGHAGPGEVLVSSTVRDAVEGSGFEFEERGVRELKGVRGEWRLYAVTALPQGPLRVPEAAVRRRARRLAMSGALALCVLLAIVYLARERGHAGSSPGGGSPAAGTAKSEGPPASVSATSAPQRAPSAPLERSIVVLPFVDMSPARDNEYFSDGMTEELINALANIEGLRVVSRTSAFAFKGKDMDVREIGSRLKVATALEGSVRKEGDRLRITAQLVNASDGYHLWSETYDRELKDVFEIQEEISRAIAEALRVELAGDKPILSPARRTKSLEAYNLYLKGRYSWERRSAADMDSAIRYFNESIALDSNFALAYSGLADVYTILWIFKPVPPSETLPRARAAARKALEIDSTLAEAHASLAQVLRLQDFDWVGSEREFRRALELDPDYATGHYFYAISLAAQGRLDEALAQARQAEELDPLSPIATIMVGRVFHIRREYDRTIEYCRKALEMNPELRMGYVLRGSAYLREGKHSQAMADFAKAAELAGYPGGDAQTGTGEGLAYTLAVAGRQAEARSRLAELERLAQTTYVSPAVIAIVHIGLGENEKALDSLERAYAKRDGWLLWLKVHPVFDPLRSEPRFEALQKKVGL